MSDQEQTEPQGEDEGHLLPQDAWDEVVAERERLEREKANSAD